MELKKINEQEYLKFALANKYISIYQLPEWGKLKEETGWISHLLGLYDNKKLFGVTLLLEKKGPLNLNLFYAPRGFLFDVDDLDLFREFTNLLKKYLKDNHGFMLKVDPNVIYATYDNNGDNKKIIDDKVFANFEKLGYKHLGFTKNFETMQPRYLCRFKLDKTYEKTIESFTKSTRKNIEKTNEMMVKTREVKEDEIDLFVSLLEESANNKHFVIRPTSYYKKMYELMYPYVRLYISYIDTDEYYRSLISKKKDKEKELNDLEKQMAVINVGNKLKNNHEQLVKSIAKLTQKIEEADILRKANDRINIGALMSLFIGDEGITFMSGTSNAYKEFNPKYAFYTYHIKECLKEKKKYCNFYGISGDLNPNSEYYSIYEIKKGFNPEVVELVGEFDLIISKFKYYLYKIAFKLYRLLKRLK